MDPHAITLSALSTTYIRSDYPPAMDAHIDAQISAFCQLFIRDGYRAPQTLTLAFYPTPQPHAAVVEQQRTSWFSTPSRGTAWETWTIAVGVRVARTETEQGLERKRVAEVLRARLIEISQRTGQEKVF